MPRPWYQRDDVRKLLTRWGIFFGILSLFFLLGRIPVVREGYQSVSSLLVRAGTSTGNAMARVLRSETSTAHALAECVVERDQQVHDAATAVSLQAQVTELQQLLAYKNQTSSTGSAARIVARALQGDVSLVILDRGTLDGISVGSAVVIGQGMLFGVVTEVRPSSAVVKLLQNTESDVPAAILGKGRTIGLVEGRGGALLTMEFIPQDADVAPGDIVVTSGLDGIVPEGLVVGVVTELIDLESAPFKSARIELLYDPRETTTALILPPSGL